MSESAPPNPHPPHARNCTDGRMDGFMDEFTDGLVGLGGLFVRAGS